MKTVAVAAFSFAICGTIPGILLSLTLFTQGPARPDAIGDFLVAAYLAGTATLLSTAGFAISTAISARWRRLRVSRAVIIAGGLGLIAPVATLFLTALYAPAPAPTVQGRPLARDGALPRHSGTGSRRGGGVDRENVEHLKDMNEGRGGNGNGGLQKRATRRNGATETLFFLLRNLRFFVSVLPVTSAPSVPVTSAASFPGDEAYIWKYGGSPFLVSRRIWTTAARSASESREYFSDLSSPLRICHIRL